jgi:MFS family permease
MGGILGQRKDSKRNFLIICILSLPFVAGMSFFQDLTLLLMSLGFFFLNFSLQPMTNVFLAQYTTTEMRGTAFGIFFFAAFGLGSFASSFSGYLAQNFGLPAVFIGLSLVTFVLIFFAVLLLRIGKDK